MPIFHCDNRKFFSQHLHLKFAKKKSMKKDGCVANGAETIKSNPSDIKAECLSLLFVISAKVIRENSRSDTTFRAKIFSICVHEFLGFSWIFFSPHWAFMPEINILSLNWFYFLSSEYSTWQFCAEKLLNKSELSVRQAMRRRKMEI